MAIPVDGLLVLDKRSVLLLALAAASWLSFGQAHPHTATRTWHGLTRCASSTGTISGPLKGTLLKALPLEHTTWEDWVRSFRRTEVLSFDTGVARDYGRDPYAGYRPVPLLAPPLDHL